MSYYRIGSHYFKDDEIAEQIVNGIVTETEHYKATILIPDGIDGLEDKDIKIKLEIKAAVLNINMDCTTFERAEDKLAFTMIDEMDRLREGVEEIMYAVWMTRMVRLERRAS